MSVYYNEWEAYPAQWLRNLIAAGLLPQGDVDERSIVDVQPDDLKGYDQCHFFAGIGGWPLAFRRAGWPDDRPVWSGSCPCQRFSSAARGRHTADDLWPEWRRLITARGPDVVFGEQVARAAHWFDGICDDMEGMDYAIGAEVLPACSVGADHARPRIFFVCDSNHNGEPGVPVNAEAFGVSGPRRFTGDVVSPDGVSAAMDGLGPISRVGALKAFGNAILPQVAAEFIRAFMECRP